MKVFAILFAFISIVLFVLVVYMSSKLGIQQQISQVRTNEVVDFKILSQNLLKNKSTNEVVSLLKKIFPNQHVNLSDTRISINYICFMHEKGIVTRLCKDK